METKEREALLAALLEGRLPDANGRYGPFGGRFVPETLMPAIERLMHGVKSILPSREFQTALRNELKSWVGRPTALTHLPTLSKRWGAEVWLKREDLAHTGAHKINNALGQTLLTRRLGKSRVIAETGAGQHGVATATACALLGLPCVVYMGAEDIARQAPNVLRMRALGAEVRAVTSGSATLKDAVNDAMRDWVTNVQTTHYVLGSAMGPHPYPTIVRDLQRVIGDEAAAQVRGVEGRLPDLALACVGTVASAQEAPASSTKPAAPVVNLNTATVADLERLPGIGPKVAARIVEYRTKKGPFRKTEELMNVQGIGEKSFLKLRSQLTVTAPAGASQQ